MRDRLWNDAVAPSDYAGPGDRYQVALLEHYKLYVEMTDRTIAQRAATNLFFLLNCGVFTALGAASLILLNKTARL